MVKTLTKKINKRSVLAVILGILIAGLIAIAAVPYVAKTTKTALAGTELYSGGALDATACDELASAAGYSDFGDLVDALDTGSTFKASSFGSYAVTFEGMDWWPVQLSKSGEDIVLTLWLKTSIGNYTFSDGTYGQNATYASNNYRYSWIRSAINMGKTPAPDNGSYYGSWPNSTATTAPKLYTNSTASASGKVVAPTAFTTFSSIISNPFIIPGGDYGDYLWLPSTAEAQSGGTWGCTSTQWSSTSTSSYCWTRSPYPSNYYYAYCLSTSGGTVSDNVDYTYGVRPALSINLKSAAQAAVAPADVEVTCNGQPQDISNAAAADIAWYKSDRVTLSYHSDSACTTSVSPVNAGEYYIKVTLKDDTNASGDYKYKFKDSVDPTGAYNTQRWMPVKFTIKKLKLGVTFTYDADGYPSVAWSATLFPNDTGNEPVLGLKYESTTGAAISDPYSVPTAIGTYKAVAYIVDEASHSYNYELDTSTATSNTFTVTARKITDPVSTTGSATKTVTYNAASQTMTLQNISADVKYTLSTGLVEDSYDSSTGTLTVSATNAGTYTVKADLADGGAGTVWSSGGTATKTFTLQINKATLSAAITGLPTSWGEGDAQTAVVTVTGFQGSDSMSNISLTVKYTKSGSTGVTVAGSGGSYAIPNDLAQGSYTFTAELDTNTNYSMSTATANFTVTPPSADFDPTVDIVWQYTQTTSSMTVPAGQGTAANPYVVTYDAEAYKFTLTLDATALAAKGVKAVYSGDVSATNASTTVYHITLTISAKDATVSYTTTTHDFYFRIDKAKFDLSSVQWDYDTISKLQYTGSQQEVTLKSSTIPTGLTANYNVATGSTLAYRGTNVGSYAVQVEFLVSDSNYVVPVYGDTTTYDGTFDFVCNWEIIKRQINLSWTNVTETDANGASMIVPRLVWSGTDYSSYVDYSFEMRDDSGNYVACGDPEVVEGTEHYYRVTVTLKSAYTANNELSGVDSKTFTTGKDKTPVVIDVTLNGSPIDGSVPFVYDGSPFDATVTIVSGNVTTNDVEIKYYNTVTGAELTSAPTDAGSYKVVVELTTAAADDNVISGSSDFAFTIDKATFDTTDVKWGYIGEDGLEHELTSTTLLEYMREGGAAKDYEIVLMNLPDELKSLVSYKINSVAGNTVAAVGTYTAEFTLAALTSDLSKNYNDVVLPSDLSNKQVFSIKARDIGTPANDGSWTTFDNLDDAHNLLELCGMDPDGLGVYYTATVMLDGAPYTGYDGDSYAAFHAGKYVVRFEVINLTGEAAGNVLFGTTTKAQEVEIEVAKKTVTVTGWTGDEEGSAAQFDDPVAALIVGTRLEDVDGNVYDLNDYYSAPAGTTFYAVPYVKAGYENDVEIVFKPGTLEKIEFSSSFEMTSQTKLIDKPYFEIDSIEYDGNSHEFKIIGLDGWEDYIYISDGDDLTQTESGSYSVTIRFISGVDACWSGSTKDNVDRKAITLNFEITKKLIYIPEIEDHSYSGNEFDVWTDIAAEYGDFVIMISGDYFATDAGSYSFVLQLNTAKYGNNIEWAEKSATAVKFTLAGATLTSSYAYNNADKTEINLTWKITKAVISGVWQKDGTLKLTIPGYNGPIDGLILYTYTDADGYSVNAEDRVSGQTYNSTAQLNPDFANNFEFDDATKKATSTPNAGAYDPTNGKGTNPGAMQKIKDFFTQKAFGIMPYWLLFLLGLLLLILLIIIIVVASRRRKSKEEKQAAKEAKEEEKARREEERQRREEERAEEKRRREEEREMQREKLEAERELARAKQEAELEKIRAQAGLGIAGMGAASMAMAQQPMQQQMPAPQPQPAPQAAQPQAQPVTAQQPQQAQSAVDNGILAQIQAELAAVRSDQAAMRNDQAAIRNEINSRGLTAYNPSQMPMPVMPQMPQMPMQSYTMPYNPPMMNGGEADYRSMYMEERARAAEARLAEERIRAAEEKMYHAAEQRAILAEERFVRGSGTYPQQIAAPQQAVIPAALPAPQQAVQPMANGQMDADFLGTAIAAALRSNAQSPAPQQVQTVQEDGAKPAPSHYPADAIITTTTTVDTSKQKGQPRAVNEDRNFDVDGFYDRYDENK